MPQEPVYLLPHENGLDSGYIFNAAQQLPGSVVDPEPSKPPCTLLLIPTKADQVHAVINPTFEPPSPTVAAAFLARSMDRPASHDADHPTVQSGTSTSPPPDGAAEFSQDLAAYYLAQYQLQGLAVNAHPAPRNATTGAPPSPPAPAYDARLPGFEELVVPLLKQRRPAWKDVDAADIIVDITPTTKVLQLACEARMTADRADVPLFDLMYDDAFVSGLLNWQGQPSKQAKDFVKWLHTEVLGIHGSGEAHGAISLQAIRCHPTSGWRLAPPAEAPGASQGNAAQRNDARQVARVTCYMCLPAEARRKHQPHHLPELTDDELLAAVDDAPAVKVLAAALFAGRALLKDALHFHLFHSLAVHAQVLQDTKAVMRSMRLGGEDFDRQYSSAVLGGAGDWAAALGPALVPAVIRASRDHILRADFAPYTFSSAASLLRFAANTVGHFDELALGLQVTKASFLEVILTSFPALVPACYHYLATYPALHVHNRDCDLVISAIEGDADAVRRIMHNAVAGYTDGRIWRLEDLSTFTKAEASATENAIAPAVVQKWAPWQCKDGQACCGLGDASCTLWHDERELRFAQEHLCQNFMKGACSNPACPNAHGFAEIRGAMNDASPICWRWLEGRCTMAHCKYAHTFRRHHSNSTRASLDGRRASMSRPRASMDLGGGGGRPRSSMDRPRASMDLGGGAPRPRASMDLRPRASMDQGGGVPRPRASTDRPRASMERSFMRPHLPAGANRSSMELLRAASRNSVPVPPSPGSQTTREALVSRSALFGGNTSPDRKAAAPEINRKSSLDIARACLESANLPVVPPSNGSGLQNRVSGAWSRPTPVPARPSGDLDSWHKVDVRKGRRSAQLDRDSVQLDQRSEKVSVR